MLTFPIMNTKHIFPIPLGLTLAVLLLGCVTVMPHNDAYYSNVLAERYPSSDFRKIDEAVLALDIGSDTTVKQLANALDAIGMNEWEDIRAAYVWIAYNIEMDTERFFSGLEPPQSSEETLESRKAMSVGFSTLFSEILSEIGFKNLIVSGYSKAFRFTAETDAKWSGHSWNIVDIDGDLHYFDPMWGAGIIKNRSFDQFFDEFYFDTKPEDFIFTNLPDQEEMQGLTEPIDRETFFKLPYLNGYSLGRGIESGPILTAVKNGETVSLPEFFKYNQDLTYVEFPMTSTLPAGERCRIVIESSSPEMMVLLGTGDREVIKPVDGRFTYEKVLIKGSVTFFLRNPRDNDVFWAICSYLVE